MMNSRRIDGGLAGGNRRIAIRGGMIVTDWQAKGFFAQPREGGGRAVLVLHPWWGLNETMRSVCRRLADDKIDRPVPADDVREQIR